MRTLFAVVTVLVLTFVLGTAVVVFALVGVPQRQNSIYERFAHWWASAIVWSAGA